jgi:hypothetical protein
MTASSGSGPRLCDGTKQLWILLRSAYADLREFINLYVILGSSREFLGAEPVAAHRKIEMTECTAPLRRTDSNLDTAS